MKNITFILLCCIVLCCCEHKPSTALQKKPNIVVIVADDLGFSDLGCMGSEISTPHLDALAKQGQLFTSFYAAATCSPTRAMLLSGTDNHIAGLGNMAERLGYSNEQTGKPGYEGYLNEKVISVAHLLKDGGYHTYIAGKWHLGLTPDHSPKANGFERSFTLLGSYANHFYPDPKMYSYWEDDGPGNYPSGKYSTDFYTNKMIEFIHNDHSDNKPFFLFAAYTSPHWPLQVPPEYIEKYHGKYDIGYDSLRVLRFNALKAKGIIPEHVKLPELPKVKGYLYSISDHPLVSWKSLDKNAQRIEARKMEIYAGMVENLDQNIGRLVAFLKEIGEYENTYIIFFSDNGPAVLEANETPDAINPLPYMGTANSFVAYGPQWAHASSAINRLYKGYSAEGGIRSPLIIKMPGQQEERKMSKAFTTVLDMAPTFLEIAGVNYPASYKRRSLAPHQGSSLLALLNKQQDFVHPEDYVMGWELFGRCALRKGKWKITKIEPPFGKGDFELFNLEDDPAESIDLSAKFPEVYREMLTHWQTYVKENGVILLEK